jgi:hypothetical protein
MPKENPADAAARERERRQSELEQGQTAQEGAAALTSDLKAVYGLRKLRGQNYKPPVAAVGKPFGSITGGTPQANAINKELQLLGPNATGQSILTVSKNPLLLGALYGMFGKK